MVYKRDVAIEVWWYTPGYDQGEDTVISSKLAGVWKTKSVSLLTTRVNVSPRRVNTVGKILKLYSSWFLSWSWIEKQRVLQNQPKTFTDIR